MVPVQLLTKTHPYLRFFFIHVVVFSHSRELFATQSKIAFLFIDFKRFTNDVSVADQVCLPHLDAHSRNYIMLSRGPPPFNLEFELSPSPERRYKLLTFL